MTESSTFSANVALRTIGSRYLIGDRVRHVTQDSDENPGVVVAVSLYPGSLRYVVAFGFGDEVSCVEFELEPADDAPATC